MKNEKIQEVIDIIKTLPAVTSARSYETPISLADAEKVFKKVIEQRLQHCLEQLKNHANEASYVEDHGVIVWKGGHFSIPVYDALLDAQEQGIKEWDRLVWQQIIRQMAIQGGYEPIYFHIATEFLLCGPIMEEQYGIPCLFVLSLPIRSSHQRRVWGGHSSYSSCFACCSGPHTWSYSLGVLIIRSLV